jgi:cytochrome c oxidase subunit II
MVIKLMQRLVVFLGVFVSQAHAFPRFNMPEGVTPISHDIYWLHMIIFWVCVAIGLGVFAVMLYVMLKHRRSQGAIAAKFHHHTMVEVIWTVIPLFILAAMAVPSTIVMLRMNDMQHAAVNIKVTGTQWRWHYAYLDEGVKYYSSLSTPVDQYEGHAKKNRWYLLEVDHPLVVPVHQKIRFLITSRDVNHSWWVPQLGVKKDAIPGMVNSAWARIDKPGIYRGNCTELCGMHHGYMPIVVVATTQQDYQHWLKEIKAGHKNAVPGIYKKAQAGGQQHQSVVHDKMKRIMSQAELLQLGKKVYVQHCSVCHKANGQGMPPAFPAIKGSAISTGPIAAHIHIVLHGKKGTAMQAFADQLSAAELASVITYQRHAWGNADRAKYGKHAGGLVQPQTIAKQLKE